MGAYLTLDGREVRSARARGELRLRHGPLLRQCRLSSIPKLVRRQGDQEPQVAEGHLQGRLPRA